VKNDTWQFGMYGLIKFENPFWLSSDVSVGRSSIDSKRSVYIESKDNLVLLDNQLNSNTNALFYSGRVNGGYDFEFSKLQTGPIFGFDFTHYRVNAFNDHEDLRTAVYYQEQNVNSFEVSLGWKVTSSLSLGGNHTILPYASLTWVRELSDGIDNKFNIRDTTDNSVREITVSSPDKSYGRGEAGIQWNVGNSLSVYTGVNSRLLNSDGSETQYTVGGAYSF
ncbi:autotransporter outer membrane beta-barrel domain-containing protein, partial [Klebsiella pneumoniae]